MQNGLDRRGNVLRLIQGYCVVQAAPTEAPRPGVAVPPTEEKGRLLRRFLGLKRWWHMRGD